MIEDSYQQTQTKISENSPDSTETDVKVVIDWCQKNYNMLHRWMNNLQALLTIKQFTKILEQRSVQKPEEPKPDGLLKIAAFKELIPPESIPITAPPVQLVIK